MKVCAGFELIAIQDATALGDDVLKIGKGREMPVGKRLIQNRPEVLGGLKLGGVWGQVDGRIPSGTARLGAVCQPALSSSSTMLRSRPAPASRANRASSAAKNGLDTPFEMYQKVSPEIGCTKAVTYSHL